VTSAKAIKSRRWRCSIAGLMAAIAVVGVLMARFRPLNSAEAVLIAKSKVTLLDPVFMDDADVFWIHDQPGIAWATGDRVNGWVVLLKKHGGTTGYRVHVTGRADAYVSKAWDISHESWTYGGGD
jgi:hypothetical protein